MKRTQPTDGRTSRAVTRALRWRARTAVVAIFSMAAVGLIAQPAYATSYPSWGDVQKAKASQSTAATQVTRINNLIASLKGEVAQTQAEAKKRGEEFAIAQTKFDDADVRARQLQQQADESKKKADAATTQAGRLAGQLYRTGGTDLSTNIFLSGGGGAKANKPDQLLSDLGSMSKLVERSSEIYRQAKTAQNSAKALSETAAVAKAEREKLRVAADAALKVAAAASQAAQDKLAEQQQNIVVMQAQLAALNDKVTTTVSGYQKGVQVRAAAKAAAERKAALAAAASRGHASSSGWAVPAYGPITDGYGPRTSPCSGCSSWHLGIDIGAGYNAPIRAAHSGTVIYAGWNGGYGNFVLLDNGGGISTGYGHIHNGGIIVRYGQHVSAGQTIAYVGTTGNSSGYHLHFEVRINGSPINGIPFMRQRGAALG